MGGGEVIHNARAGFWGYPPPPDELRDGPYRIVIMGLDTPTPCLSPPGGLFDIIVLIGHGFGKCLYLLGYSALGPQGYWIVRVENLDSSPLPSPLPLSCRHWAPQYDLDHMYWASYVLAII